MNQNDKNRRNPQRLRHRDRAADYLHISTLLRGRTTWNPNPVWGFAGSNAYPGIGVGVFALLYVFIPKASESSTGHKNLYRVLFWTFSVLYVEGHGMHLAANSIGNNLVTNTDARLARSIFLFDEPIGLALIAVAYQSSYTSRDQLTRRQIWLILIGWMLYGVSFALTIIEGQSALWAGPIVIVALFVLGVRWLRGKTNWYKQPASTFFVTGFSVVLVTLGVWLLRFGSFVEPSTIFVLP